MHSKSYVPGYYSMRDMNEDSNSSSWPLFYGDKTLTNGQYYNNFQHRTVTDSYPGYNKNVLKQKMLEHEAIFKNQVYELHRLYRTQRNLMEEFKKKELHSHQIPIEASSSSSLLPYQMPSEDAQKWHIASFPLANPGHARPSVLGADVINSPSSCTKGNSTQAVRVPYPNGFALKDCEVLECRPSKVRKKLFGLPLPDDEYIGTEEGQQLEGNKDIATSHLLNGYHRIGPERGVKFSIHGGNKTDCPRITSTSDSCLQSSLGLADLNQPVQVEPATGPTSIDLRGHSACHGDVRELDHSAKPRLGLPRGSVQNFQHGSNNGTSNSLSLENKGNGREWLTFMYETGNSKSNLNTIPQRLQPDKLPIPSHPTRFMLNKAHQSVGNFPTDHSRGDRWREKSGSGIEISDRSHDGCNYNNPDPVLGSRISSPYPFVNSPDLTNSWSHSVSSWGNPSSSLTQKLMSAQTNPSFNLSSSLSKNSQPSGQSHEIFGAKWHVNGSSRLNTGLLSEPPTRNGFYHESSSGAKERLGCVPSIGFKSGDNIASECEINRASEKFFKGSNFLNLRSMKDMNLNVVPKDSAVPQQGSEIVDEKNKPEDHLAGLPWLRAKPAFKNEVNSTRRDSNSIDFHVSQASSNQLGKNGTFTRDDVTSASSDCGIKKIPGFPIFENPFTSNNESSLVSSTSASCQGEDVKIEGKHIVIDINVAASDFTVPDCVKQTCAEALIVEKDTVTNNLRNYIDLNSSCMSEDDDPLAPSVVNTSANVKIAVEIDLEAPLVQETNEAIVLEEKEQKQDEEPSQSPQHKAEYPDIEFSKTAAAEAIVAISSSGHRHHIEETTCQPTKASLSESLLWFSEVVVSSACVDESGRRDSGRIGKIIPSEIDYFEAMTLQLTETKEEDYMPEPLVPENREAEETGLTLLPNRTRKAQPRRGRQRRDFQKDILPGLTSLSRHEITEDLQTFGGLMRATGHPWQSGPTRRNGSARGRRRLVVDPAPHSVVASPSPVCTPLLQQLNRIEVGLKDRSLTGWGKTTRRPRQKRCPAGNNTLAVTLT